MFLSTCYLEYGRHVARLRRRRRAYGPTSNTASHDNHEEINSWVSFCFPYLGCLWGSAWRLRYKRLAFGGLNSQDLFDAEIAKIISGIPRVLNNRDDIMVGGVAWKDYNANLRMLLQRIEDHNLTLRREKCEFGKTTFNFHGHLFTTNGLKPSADKIKPAQHCMPPKTKEDQGRPRNSSHSRKCWHTSPDTSTIAQADASHLDAWQE